MPNLQTLVDWANMGVVLALAASFVVGGASIYLSRRIGSQKDAQYLREKQASDEKIALAGESAARADARAATANEGVAKSKQEIARLTLEAEQAKTERAEADKQIAVAKADAARAKEGIANAEAVSAQAGVEVARLQVVVASAEKRRLEAEKALLELQERIRDRHLTTSQRARLLDLLNQGPKGSADIVWTGDEEARKFALELMSVLTEAGWTSSGLSQSFFTGAEVKGVLISGRGPVPPEANALYQALVAIGLNPGLNSDPNEQPGVWSLVVGRKP